MPDEASMAFAAEIDTEALLDKYRVERDRRLRREGNDQYVEIAGRFEGYLDDPYADPDYVRPPISEALEVVIVGGGMGGLLTAARLRADGVERLRVVERGGDFGGTWYWNRYPGAACDTESYIYMPLLEETDFIPTAKYAKAPELLEHCRRIGRHFDLYESALFQTVITEAHWDESGAHWSLETNRGDQLTAKFLVLACGTALGRPKLPGVPGIEKFNGTTFHTSRWDYSYTGGDAAGGLVGLQGKRVGIIGTGATAVQCIPHLGEWADTLYVFQRTPSSVGERNDSPTDPQWAAGLKPGWQKERIDNFTTVISGGDFDVDLVNDGWTDVIGNVLLAARRRQRAGEYVEDPEALVQMADFQKMEQVRSRIDAVVRDRQTAEALKPWYNQLCKRPCFHDQYLQSFNNPNVHLIDTGGQGVERITEKGVVVDGVEYEIDCLIYATGFEVGTEYVRTTGFEIYGRDGRSLTEKWEAGPETLHSIFIRGFPNCFMLSATQSGQSANFQHMLDVKAKHITHVVRELSERRVTQFDLSQSAEKDWVDTIVKLALAREPFLRACTPGYYNNEGAPPDSRSLQGNQYWRGPIQFIKILDRWRMEGTLPGLELTYEADEHDA